MNYATSGYINMNSGYFRDKNMLETSKIYNQDSFHAKLYRFN